MKITVTNTARANRGFYDVSGQRISVKPGQTVTVDVDEDTAAAIRANPDFVHAGGTLRAEGEAVEGFMPPQGDETPLVEEAPAPLSDEVLLGMSKEDFAAYYESALGKAPHHMAKRETLIGHIRENEGA